MKVVVEAVLRPPHRDDLFRELREAGYEPEARAALERRDAEQVWEVVLWVRDHLAPGAALALAKTVGKWAWRKLRRRGSRLGSVRVLYAPNGEVLAEVPVDETLEE